MPSAVVLVNGDFCRWVVLQPAEDWCPRGGSAFQCQESIHLVIFHASSALLLVEKGAPVLPENKRSRLSKSASVWRGLAIPDGYGNMVWSNYFNSKDEAYFLQEKL
ncbi:hypothetical protein HNY73_015404 [Argiope bruennichi]|uniref:Uncharacterized protein n=1 Tax=Argiope bruennichi TaxID=94029 RepID=A0A8T0ESI4_ARGBR|nr:hypothetical protein HNY73_015404 [Argiope bruennichi]